MDCVEDKTESKRESMNLQVSQKKMYGRKDGETKMMKKIQKRGRR